MFSVGAWFQEWLGRFPEVESGNEKGQGEVVDSFDTVSSHFLAGTSTSSNRYKFGESTVRDNV